VPLHRNPQVAVRHSSNGPYETFKFGIADAMDATKSSFAPPLDNPMHLATIFSRATVGSVELINVTSHSTCSVLKTVYVARCESSRTGLERYVSSREVLTPHTRKPRSKRAAGMSFKTPKKSRASVADSLGQCARSRRKRCHRCHHRRGSSGVVDDFSFRGALLFSLSSGGMGYLIQSQEEPPERVGAVSFACLFNQHIWRPFCISSVPNSIVTSTAHVTLESPSDPSGFLGGTGRKRVFYLNSSNGNAFPPRTSEEPRRKPKDRKGTNSKVTYAVNILQIRPSIDSGVRDSSLRGCFCKTAPPTALGSFSSAMSLFLPNAFGIVMMTAEMGELTKRCVVKIFVLFGFLAPERK